MLLRSVKCLKAHIWPAVVTFSTSLSCGKHQSWKVGYFNILSHYGSCSCRLFIKIHAVVETSYIAYVGIFLTYIISLRRWTLKTRSLMWGLTYMTGSFFVRFQKNSRPAEKNSRPILLKKLNLSEANSHFTKKPSRNFISKLQFFMGVTCFRSFLLTNI